MTLFANILDQLCFLFILGCGGLFVLSCLLVRSGAASTLAKGAGKSAAQYILGGIFKKR